MTNRAASRGLRVPCVAARPGAPAGALCAPRAPTFSRVRRYRCSACCVSSRTRSWPSLQGTTMPVLPKHTVTFILAARPRRPGRQVSGLGCSRAPGRCRAGGPADPAGGRRGPGRRRRRPGHLPGGGGSGSGSAPARARPALSARQSESAARRGLAGGGGGPRPGLRWARRRRRAGVGRKLWRRLQLRPPAPCAPRSGPRPGPALKGAAARGPGVPGCRRARRLAPAPALPPAACLPRAPGALGNWNETRELPTGDGNRISRSTLWGRAGRLQTLK